MTTQTRIDDFCHKFERALKQLGVEGRADIVAEIRAHLQDGAATGELDDRLRELGTPERYGRIFRDELRIEQAYVRADPYQTMGTLLVLSSHRLAAAIGLFFSGTLYIFALGFAVTLVMELIAPEKTGLWIDREQGLFVFGSVAEAEWLANTPEILGFFYLPVAAALGLLSFLLAGYVGRFAVRAMRGPRDHS